VAHVIQYGGRPACLPCCGTGSGGGSGFGSGDFSCLDLPLPRGTGTKLCAAVIGGGLLDGMEMALWYFPNIAGCESWAATGGTNAGGSDPAASKDASPCGCTAVNAALWLVCGCGDPGPSFSSLAFYTPTTGGKVTCPTPGDFFIALIQDSFRWATFSPPVGVFRGRVSNTSGVDCPCADLTPITIIITAGTC
jgi:hypothetical protein